MPPVQPVDSAPTTFNAWTPQRLIAAGVMALIGIVATWDAWGDIAHEAMRDEESSHVMLVPLVAAWIIWTRLDSLRDARPVHVWIGPVVIAVGAALRVTGEWTGWHPFWHAGTVLIVLGCVLAVVGGQVLWRALPAFFVLLFVVPVAGQVRAMIAPPLMTVTAQITDVLLNTVGIPVERSGNVLTINGTAVAVAEACNGLRMVFALFLVAYTYAFVFPLSLFGRTCVILASPLIAVIANIIRLMPTVWLFGNADAETAEWFHDISGWGMLPIAFLAIMGVERLVKWVMASPTDEASEQATSATATHATAEPSVASDTASVTTDSMACAPRGVLVWPALAIVMLVAMTVESSIRTRDWIDARVYRQQVRAATIQTPRTWRLWRGEDIEMSRHALRSLRPTAWVNRRYRHAIDGTEVEVLFLYSEEADDLMGHYPPACYPANGMPQRAADEQTWIVNGDEIHAMRYRFGPEDDNRGLSVLNLLVIPGVGYAKDMVPLGRIELDRSRQPYGAAQMQIITDPRMDPQRTETVIQEMLELLHPAMRTMLDGIHRPRETSNVVTARSTSEQ